MNKELIKRIEVAASCHDSDYIPKVSDSGEIFFDQVRHKEYQVMHNGLKVYTDSHYGAFNTSVIKRLKGHHEPQEEKVFYEVLKAIANEGVMIELGSFWAYYSMWFTKEIPHAKTYLIEPMQLEHGKENYALNDLGNGTFVEAFIGQTSEYQSDFKHWDGQIYKRDQISIDDFIQTNNLDHVDILHSDIQGAEFEMLLGAQRTLHEGKVDFIFVSTHSMSLHAKCLTFLKSFDYEVIAEHTPLQSFSVDGLIAVHHKNIDFAPVTLSTNHQQFLKQLLYKIKDFLHI